MAGTFIPRWRLTDLRGLGVLGRDKSSLRSGARTRARLPPCAQASRGGGGSHRADLVAGTGRRGHSGGAAVIRAGCCRTHTLPEVSTSWWRKLPLPRYEVNHIYRFVICRIVRSMRYSVILLFLMWRMSISWAAVEVESSAPAGWRYWLIRWRVLRKLGGALALRRRAGRSPGRYRRVPGQARRQVQIARRRRADTHQA
jgi:hypothetical protein